MTRTLESLMALATEYAYQQEALAQTSDALVPRDDARATLSAAIADLIAERDALAKDAARYRFIRDANRSDCITRELSLYAMETLDEYVDAAMEDEDAT